MRFTGLLAALLPAFVALPLLAASQTLQGSLVEEAGKAMTTVQIHNVHTGAIASADSIGHFEIAAKAGELVEFRSSGYEVSRLRVPAGNIPQLRVQLRAAITDHPEYASLSPAQRDSAKLRDVFTRALAMPKLKGYQMIQSPFSALSKRNRRIWAFQDDFQYTEEQKYIDRVFNPTLIASITHMPQDSIVMYARTNRPTYEMLLSMKEYEFYSYIRQSAEAWRRNERGRRATMRSSQ